MLIVKHDIDNLGIVLLRYEIYKPDISLLSTFNRDFSY